MEPFRLHDLCQEHARLSAHLSLYGWFLLEQSAEDIAASNELRRQSTQFFATPERTKRGLGAPSGVPRGYTALAAEGLAYSRAAGGPPDLNESFQIGARGAENLWPASREFREAWERYFARMEQIIAIELLAAFALALGADKELFLARSRQAESRLRARHYPPVEGKVLPGQARAGEHTDYGTFAVLLPDEASPGLEVQGRDGRWALAGERAGCFVVNLGDLFERWSNGRWLAPLHRVAAPAEGPARTLSRLTHIYFHAPDAGAVVDPRDVFPEEAPKFAPVTGAGYVSEKLARASSRKSTT